MKVITLLRMFPSNIVLKGFERRDLAEQSITTSYPGCRIEVKGDIYTIFFSQGGSTSYRLEGIPVFKEVQRVWT